MSWKGVRAKKRGERPEHPEPIGCDAPASSGSNEPCNHPATVRVKTTGKHLCPKHHAVMRAYYGSEPMPELEAV